MSKTIPGTIPRTFSLAAALAGCLATASIASTSTPGAPPTGEPCALESKLDARFYKNSTRKNIYNLAFENPTGGVVTVKVLAADGSVAKSARYRFRTHSTTMDLSRLAPGAYSVEIYSGAGCKVATESITIGQSHLHFP